MDFLVAILRFVFGAILGGILVASLLIWISVPLWLGLGITVLAGVIAVFSGDSALVGFMQVFRWIQGSAVRK
jgi:hypothetical protein